MSRTIENLKESIPDFARDIKINLANCLTPDGSPGLQAHQIAGAALSSAYAVKNADLAAFLKDVFQETLSSEAVTAAKAAATIMAMNNVYYRFLHLTSDKDYQSMPAKLRMMVIQNSGIPKIDFEIDCLAVSAVNGCGMCMDSHAKHLTQSGLSKEAVQSVIRIASVVFAAAQALTIKAFEAS